MSSPTNPVRFRSHSGTRLDNMLPRHPPSRTSPSGRNTPATQQSRTLRSPEPRPTGPQKIVRTPPDSASHASFWLVVTTTVLCLVVSVTFKLNDPDFWQHLLVGKAIWQSQTVPSVHLWSWPTLGQPEVVSSWGFCAFLWPFWSLAHVTGLYVWRW